jgi:uncharacterized caspase-like protein
VVAQNDDVAQGVIAALRAAGIVPGRDVFVVGADGTSNAAHAIESGQQLATSANSPAYVAGLFTARIYDVTHGWVPRASERLQYWRSITTTKDNVNAYLERYVDNKGVEPFDYRKISKVLHPTDWDPQAEITPLDIDHEWGAVAKPDGWTYPKAYLDSATALMRYSEPKVSQSVMVRTPCSAMSLSKSGATGSSASSARTEPASRRC